jgi:hypothetical protein
MIYLEPSCLDHTFSPLPQEKLNESRMERRPGTECCKGFIGRLLRDEEQGSNPDQRAQALLGVRATPFSARRAWRKVRSHRGMQNHTAELTRALDRHGIVQTVLTTRPPTAPYFQRLGDHARVIRVGFPV